MIAAVLRLWHFDDIASVVGQLDGGDGIHKIQAARRVERGILSRNNFKQPQYLAITTGGLFRLAGRFAPVRKSTRWRLATLSMIVYSLLALIVTYHLALAVFRDTGVALWSALVFAVIPLDVVGSRYFKEDVPLMFYSNLALLLLINVVRAPRLRSYLLAGLAIGVAAGVKYSGGSLLLLYALAHLLNLRAERNRGGHHVSLAPAFISGLSAAAFGFLAFNPHLILEGKRYAAGLGFQFHYVASGHHDGTVITLADYFGTYGIRFALLPGLTAPVFLAAAWGGFAALGRRHRGGIFLAGWALGFYLLFEALPAKPPFFARYLQPLVPALCVLAGCTLATLAMAGARRPAFKVLAGGVAMLIVANALLFSLLINEGIVRDTRAVAVEWVDRHLPAGSTIYRVKRFTASPKNPALVVRSGDLKPLPDLQAAGIDYLLVSSLYYDRYRRMGRRSQERARRQAAELERIAASCRLVREFRPRWSLQSFGFHNPVVRLYRLPSA